MRERLEQCIARLRHVWRRLRAVQLGDSQERLVAEFEAVERTCEAADALLDAAGHAGSSRDDMVHLSDTQADRIRRWLQTGEDEEIPQ